MTIKAFLGLCTCTLGMGAAPFEPSPEDCSPWQFVPREQYEARSCDLRIRLHFHLVGWGADLPLPLLVAQVNALNHDFEMNATGIGFEFDADVDVTRYYQSLAAQEVVWIPPSTGQQIHVWVDRFEEFQGEASEPDAARAGDDATRWILLDVDALGPRGVSAQPDNLGRTLAHELGHTLGLLHPWEGGCSSATAPSCYSEGDTLCDTAPMQEPSKGGSCKAHETCGQSLHPRNIMDWSDDRCRTEFTPEQVMRMRCSVLHWGRR